MKNTWIVLGSVILITTIISPTQASWQINRYSQVTVFVMDNQNNLLGSQTYTDSSDILTPTKLLGPFTSWFSLNVDSGASLFENVQLLDNVGKTYWISSNTDAPQYSAFVKALTDSCNDTIWGNFTLNYQGGFAGGSGLGYFESSYFSSGHSHGFFGMNIGQIGIRIDAASVTQTDSNLPEPSSVITIICGIMGICVWSRKRYVCSQF